MRKDNGIAILISTVLTNYGRSEGVNTNAEKIYTDVN